MMEAIRRLFRKRHKPIPKRGTRLYKSQRAKKPVPVETPEEAEVRRRMNANLFNQFTRPTKPGNLAAAERIIIAPERYAEDWEAQLRSRILDEVRREAKDNTIIEVEEV